MGIYIQVKDTLEHLLKGFPCHSPIPKPMHSNVLKSSKIHVLKNRDIPNSRHIKGKPIHGPKGIRNRHHIVNYIIVRLRLRQRNRYRSRVDESIRMIRRSHEPAANVRRISGGGAVGATPGGESTENSFAVIETHVGNIPIIFFAEAAEDGAE